MINEKTISTEQLIDFLKLPSVQTLYSWLRSGVLGLDFISNGRPRKYSFSREDTVAVTLARAVINTFKDFFIARKAVEEFRKYWGNTDFEKMPSMGIHVFQNREVYFTLGRPGIAFANDSGICSITTIQIDQIIRSVDELFERK